MGVPNVLSPMIQITVQYVLSPVTEVEVTEVTVLLNSVVQPLVQYLDEGTHIGKVLVHLGAVGEVAGKRRKFIVKMLWSSLLYLFVHVHL